MSLKPNLLLLVRAQISVGSKASMMLEIDNDNIEIVRSFKYLGVQVDNQLKWDDHIDKVKKKALRALGPVKYSKKYLSSEVLAKIYRGLVEPHLSYCCSVWRNCSKRKIDSLQKVQNRAARIIMNSAYDASAAPLIQSLGWPTISNLIQKKQQHCCIDL